MLTIKAGAIVAHYKRFKMWKSDIDYNPNIYLYEIVDVAVDCENGKTMVVYRALYDEKRMYVRPIENFCGFVDMEGRFRFEEWNGTE